MSHDALFWLASSPRHALFARDQLTNATSQATRSLFKDYSIKMTSSAQAMGFHIRVKISNLTDLVVWMVIREAACGLLLASLLRSSSC